MESEGGKGVVEHQTRCLGAIALALTLGLADKDTEGSRAVSEVYAVQSSVADRPQGLLLVDRKRRVVFGLRLPILPVLLLLARHGERRESQRAPSAKVVDPTLVERQEIPPQWAKCHQLACNVQDRLLVIVRALSPHARLSPRLADARDLMSDPSSYPTTFSGWSPAGG